MSLSMTCDRLVTVLLLLILNKKLKTMSKLYVLKKKYLLQDCSINEKCQHRPNIVCSNCHCNISFPLGVASKTVGVFLESSNTIFLWIVLLCFSHCIHKLQNFHHSKPRFLFIFSLPKVMSSL